jgi:hypothetical protein
LHRTTRELARQLGDSFVPFGQFRRAGAQALLNLLQLGPKLGDVCFARPDALLRVIEFGL